MEWNRSTCSGWFALERGMTIQMTLRLIRAALVVKVQGRTAVWPRATWILPGLSETSREAATPAGKEERLCSHTLPTDQTSWGKFGVLHYSEHKQTNMTCSVVQSYWTTTDQSPIQNNKNCSPLYLLETTNEKFQQLFTLFQKKVSSCSLARFKHKMGKEGW